MPRLFAISLLVMLIICAATAAVVLGQRRSFEDPGAIVFAMGRQSYKLYSIRPNASFGEDWNTLFDPNGAFADRYVTGVDCSADRSALIFWYIFMYRYDLTTDNLTQLVLGQGMSQESVWSPDGGEIAYIDDRETGLPREIFTVRSDGSAKMQRSENGYQETSLSWSPDGEHIAFTYKTVGDLSLQGVAVLDMTSGETRSLYEARTYISDAAWSPDGTRIAFSLGGDRVVDIYTIQPDGANLTRLTGGGRQNIIPRWSPDGTLISYSSRELGGQYSLYVMNADGSSPYMVFIKPDSQDAFNRCWLG
jgi:WD40 repeat protein